LAVKLQLKLDWFVLCDLKMSLITFCIHKMKTKRIAAVLVFSALLPSISAYAADGTITFEGEIVAATCVATATSASATIQLPKVSVNALKTAGNTAGAQPFHIDLEHCGANVTNTIGAIFTAAQLFQGNSVANTATNGAKHVGIAIFKENGTQVNLGQASVTGQAPDFQHINAEKASLNYVAKYIADGAATEGPVHSQVTFDLVYQ
jgi:major type 1 subunit fimbrin (pilin)